MIGSASYSSQGCSNLLSFYNPTSNSCAQCLSSTISGRATICSCRVGIASSNCGGTCGAGQIRSVDGTFCLNCPGATVQVTANGYTQTVCDCAAGEYFSDRDASGTALTTATCQACQTGYYPSQNRSRCLACADPINMAATLQGGIYSCQCKQNSGFSQTPVGGQCVLSTALNPVLNTYGSASKQVTITTESSTIQLTPDFVNDYFVSSVSTCQDGNLVGCQVMANICVMSMYNRNHPACAAYLSMAADSSRASILNDPYQNQPLGLPWIFWTTQVRESAKQTRDRQPALTVTAGKVLYLINQEFSNFIEFPVGNI